MSLSGKYEAWDGLEQHKDTFYFANCKHENVFLLFWKFQNVFLIVSKTLYPKRQNIPLYTTLVFF
jgi:hypothetical protein